MKAIQAAVGYGRGTPIRNCGYCKHYQGHNACAIVAGWITPFGDCDRNAMQKNPWGSRLTAEEKAIINRMMEK